MNGFLFDENLPVKIQFTPSLPIVHVSILGDSPSDTQIWQYANDKSHPVSYQTMYHSDRYQLITIKLATSSTNRSLIL